MAGPLFSLEIYFKEEGKPYEIIAFLVNEVFKDYFIPQSVYFKYKKNGNDFEHIFGIDRNLIKRNKLLPNEKEIESIRFTKLSTPSYGRFILNVLSEEITYYGFSALGSLKTYYQKDSKLYCDFFFREKLTRYYKPIVEICARNIDLRKFAREKLTEHSISFEFIDSRIFLDERFGIGNKVAAEKNIELIANNVKKLIEKFKDVYDHSYCIIEGWGYYNKIDSVRRIFSKIPNFEGFN